MTPDHIADIITRCEIVEDIDRRLPDTPSPATVLAADCRWLMLREAAQRREITDLRSLLRRLLGYYDNPAVSDVRAAAEAAGLVWDKTKQVWAEKA